MATTTKHPAYEHHHQAAAHHAAAAHHHLEAAHHHDTGEHDQAKKHAEAAHHHSEHGHKHTTTGALALEQVSLLYRGPGAFALRCPRAVVQLLPQGGSENERGRL